MSSTFQTFVGGVLIASISGVSVSVAPPERCLTDRIDVKREYPQDCRLGNTPKPHYYHVEQPSTASSSYVIGSVLAWGQPTFMPAITLPS